MMPSRPSPRPVDDLGPMWTLMEAIELIGPFQAALRPFDFHVALGGGVLNKGSSINDLDLYVLPVFKDRPYHWNALEQLIYEFLGQHSDLLHTSEGPMTKRGPCFRYQWRCVRGGKVIDVFVVDPRTEGSDAP